MNNQRPNIVFIFADDWGWGDLGCYGHKELKTPNLDKLAANGSRFNRFYVTSGVCSPSRCSVVTGHYPARHMVHGHFASFDENTKREMPNWLDLNVTSMPRLMQEAGYRTAHYGKWHLGGGGGVHGHSEAPGVIEYGYDDTRTWNGNGPTWYQTEKWPFTLPNDVDEIWAGASARLAVESTMEFIGQDSDKPFFVNLWLKDPHTPLRPTPEQRAEYPDTPEPYQTYYSVLTAADKQIGRLMDYLEKENKLENTLILFSSDNGPESILNPKGETQWCKGSTGGLRGRKRSLYDGGVCVPFIAHWSGKVPAGVVNDDVCLSSVDLFPTFVSLANGTLPDGYEPDGVDISDVLTGKEFKRPCPLMWEWRFSHDSKDYWAKYAIRDEEFVMLFNPDTGKKELYDTSEDRSQTNNIIADYPQKAVELEKQSREWSKLLPGYKRRKF
jgi:arylsulfatase A-like enzyme